MKVREQVYETAKGQKECNRRVGLAAGRALRSLGAFTRYCSDGLTGRGMYWFAPGGYPRLSWNPKDSAETVLTRHCNVMREG